MGHARDRKEWIVLDRLADIILSNVNGCIVDIGMGLSTMVLGGYAVMYSRNHYSCDISRTIFNRFKKLHANHYATLCDSITFIKHLHDFPIAIAFLDGPHNFTIVKYEILVLLEFLAINGVIFIHDTNPPVKWKDKGCGDVYKIKNFIRQIPSVDHFLWPYLSQAQGCGLSMVIKHE